MNKVKIAARTLVETVCRDGGLSQLSFSNLSPQAGTRTHKSFYEYLDLLFSDYRSLNEVSLDIAAKSDNLELDIQGRADVILIPSVNCDAEIVANEKNDKRKNVNFCSDKACASYKNIYDDFAKTYKLDSSKKSNIKSGENYSTINKLKNLNIAGITEIKDKMKIDCLHVLEVKTVSLSLDELNMFGNSLHWFQAMIYAAMIFIRFPELLLDCKLDSNNEGEINLIDNQDICGSELENSKLFLDYNTLDFKSLRGESEAEIYRFNCEFIRRRFDNRLIPFVLAYVSQESLDCRLLYRTIRADILIDYFEELVYSYLDFALNTAKYQEIRDKSIKNMSFPYPSLRDGQKIFMQELLSSVMDRIPLFAELPTGTGKTIASLYPSIKVIPHKSLGKIFYLTAKTSTREVAEKALRDLRDSGLFLRSICLRAKEQSCLEPELYCDHNLCPYAINYYKNLAEGLKELLSMQEITADKLADISKKHKLCPFELSLDIALFCDVIIGDYNHVLDPRVRLERFFYQSRESHTLLFDEAHNLVDRSRDMYSVDIKSKDLDDLRHMFTGEENISSSIIDKLDQLRAFFDSLRLKSLEASLRAFFRDNEPSHTADIDDEGAYEEPGLFIMKAQSAMLNELIREFLKVARFLFDLSMDIELKRKLVEVFSSLRYYLRIVDEFWSDRFIFAFRANERAYHHRLICLDPSTYIRKSFYPSHSAIFFSATLSPYSYYAKTICEDDKLSRTISLNSPFPKENLKVIVYTGTKTTYQYRDAFAEKTARALAFAATRLRGHQLFFFPSFAYMNKVLPNLKKYIPSEIKLVTQTASMSIAEREEFISKFNDISDNNRDLIGFAVLGGIFSEGIDLIGPRLDGVSIVGVGIPQLSAERNMMLNYYNDKFGDGFFYAYQFPGFNKVLQAAGRLVRSAEDLGCLLLIDERYREERYISLFPSHWDYEFCENEVELCEKLESCYEFINESRAYMDRMGINYRYESKNSESDS